MRFCFLAKFQPAVCLSLVLLTAVLAGCNTRNGKRDSDNNNSTVPTLSIDHPVGDPSVPPEMGGPGFTGEGWTTATPDPMGDPRAVKGGAMLASVLAWPDNLRMYGIRANTHLNYLVRGLCYESLLGMDRRTLEFTPSLATHWKISDDKMQFSFRLNPRAHWSDGRPVTAEDFIATYRLIADDTLLDPMMKSNLVDKMEEPVARSKYMFDVNCKERDWRNFITISGMVPLPAHEISGLTGKEYLDKYNFAYTAVNGPYIVHQKDIKTDESITLTRRRDYWGVTENSYDRLYNFDKIRFVVIRDNRLAFEKARNGELDFISVNVAKWWVEDLPDWPAVEKGHLIRRKVFTRYPKGIQGQALNMPNPVLDDVRARKALAHLFDRKTMLEKFAYNEYERLKTYYPSSDAENPDNELVEYDPRRAAELLAEAGWKEKGPDGILVKDGRRFSINFSYSSKGLEKYYTVYKEHAKRVGVELNLRETDPATAWNNLQDRKFEMSSAAWGAILFPNPKTSWHGTMADRKGSNNVTGLQNKEADRIIEKYDKEFDLAKRNELLRQLDGILFDEHPYVLGWFMPCERFMYWNKFSMPDTVLYKYQEWEDIFSLWWVDPEKEKQLKAARKSGENLPIPPIVVRPWDGQENLARRNEP